MSWTLLAVMVVLAVACGWLIWQVLALRQAVAGVPLGDEELYSLMNRIDNELGLHDAAIGDLQEAVSYLEPQVRASLQHTGVVVYDAYADVGGARSRSIAFLNGEGSGIVVTLLVSRTETQFYVKGITLGAGQEPLSPEEQEAVRRALQG